MDIDFTPEQQAFRAEVRDWLEANKPRGPQPKDGAAQKAHDLAWQAKQYEGGWAGIGWPKEHGGRGLDIWSQMIWYEEFSRAGCSLGCNFMGLNHGGRTVANRGTDEQRAFHLSKILKGELVWCQGFSEPSAGSDLAGIKTRGVIDGEEIVVTGQKIWTSFAHLADYQILLIRTDPDTERHQGLTLVINKMDNAGVTARPIKTLDGGAHFCEVFYDEVRIPIDQVVGDIGDGWNVAMSTLSLEHGTSNIGFILETVNRVEALIDFARHAPRIDGPGNAIDDSTIAERLAWARAQVTALRTMLYLSLSRSVRDPNAPGGGMGRLPMSLLMQELGDIANAIRGPRTLSLAGDEGKWTHGYLNSLSETIGGGTAEIQRNNIGRALGLPK